jgi:microcystin-dependent protein
MLAGFNFQVNGWSFCNGALMAISENTTLFTLIGTTYGGDGQQTFQVPDLQGRVPIHQGGGYVIGQKGGVESVTLTTNQIPSHNHGLVANAGVASVDLPSSALFANSGQNDVYVSGVPPANAMNAGTLGSAGGSQPHENMQPYLVVNYLISLFGVFPTQN